ncbi:ureidoglycolate lyase [Oryzicola mucosus]|uniref:Ureidoglycolate lyase n=1 Tax=Oryzicola mucosus TaxID=2767425 RepID=A0A8J6PH39_9HYPH|nr:ureidoglycolate lyase [Oryzicola mucosus]MBD0413913.1 ureidoglycolate lyase [Oryzicola mucosus]
MNHLLAAQLTEEAFRPFGTVSDVSDLTGLLTIHAAYEAGEPASEPVLQLVKIESIPQPLTIVRLEIHPHSAQTFLSLDMAPSLVVVCEPNAAGEPDLATARAFIARPTQVVTYNRGVLHHRLTPLKTPAVFAMTMMHSSDGDTVVFDLQEPIAVAWPD